MTDQLHDIRNRQASVEMKMARLSLTTAEIHEEIKKISKLIRGNGEEGLFGQVRMNRERIEVLRGQWKWILGMLAAIAVGVARGMMTG